MLNAPQELRVSSRVVLGLVRAVEHAGVSRQTLLRAAGLDNLDELLEADVRVPTSQLNHVCEIALDLTGDPAFGIHWAERLNQNTFGPVSHLIAHSGTLRKALESLAQFHRLVTDEPSSRLVERNGEAMLYRLPRAGESLRVQRLASEVMIVGFCRLLRSFVGGARPEQVAFSYAAPTYSAEYERVFESRASFDRPFTGIVFDRALMDAPSPDKDDEVHAALCELAERRLLRITQQTPYTHRLREFLLREEWWRHRGGMPSVARVLGLSERSLRRRLAHENTSYVAVTNEVLAIAAKRLLRQQRTIQETAHEMGFSDTSSFHRAFKQWTGTTPNTYRAAKFEHDAR